MKLFVFITLLILLLANLWTLIFTSIPAVIRDNKTKSWIFIGISISAIIMCSFTLGRLAEEFFGK